MVARFSHAHSLSELARLMYIITVSSNRARTHSVSYFPPLSSILIAYIGFQPTKSNLFCPIPPTLLDKSSISLTS
jgi:hypothetical protein